LGLNSEGFPAIVSEKNQTNPPNPPKNYTKLKKVPLLKRKQMQEKSPILPKSAES